MSSDLKGIEQPSTMKRTTHSIILLAALAGLMAVTGCQTVSTNSKEYLGGPTFPPTDPLQVEILRATPTRPHVQLGQVTAEPSSDSVPRLEIEQALQKAAAKMGANAVVITADRTQIMGAYVTGPLWGRQVDTITGRVIVGVAIHYTGR
jgi:hypothetical protein